MRYSWVLLAILSGAVNTVQQHPILGASSSSSFLSYLYTASPFHPRLAATAGPKQLRIHHHGTSWKIGLQHPQRADQNRPHGMFFGAHARTFSPAVCRLRRPQPPQNPVPWKTSYVHTKRNTQHKARGKKDVIHCSSFGIWCRFGKSWWQLYSDSRFFQSVSGPMMDVRRCLRLGKLTGQTSFILVRQCSTEGDILQRCAFSIKLIAYVILHCVTHKGTYWKWESALLTYRLYFNVYNNMLLVLQGQDR